MSGKVSPFIYTRDGWVARSPVHFPIDGVFRHVSKRQLMTCAQFQRQRFLWETDGTGMSVRTKIFEFEVVENRPVAGCIAFVADS